QRLVRGLDRAPPGAHARGPVVVVLYRGHRLGVEFAIVVGGPVLVWSRWCGLFPQPGQSLYGLVAQPRTLTGGGCDVAKRALGRGVHPPAGSVGAVAGLMAHGVSDLRRDRSGLGILVLRLVPR